MSSERGEARADRRRRPDRHGGDGPDRDFSETLSSRREREAARHSPQRPPRRSLVDTDTRHRTTEASQDGFAVGSGSGSRHRERRARSPETRTNDDRMPYDAERPVEARRNWGRRAGRDEAVEDDRDSRRRKTAFDDRDDGSVHGYTSGRRRRPLSPQREVADRDDGRSRGQPRAPLAPRGVYDDSGRRLDRSSEDRPPRRSRLDEPPPRKRLRDGSAGAESAHGRVDDSRESREVGAASPPMAKPYNSGDGWRRFGQRQDTSSEAEQTARPRTLGAVSRWNRSTDDRGNDGDRRSAWRGPADTDNVVRLSGARRPQSPPVDAPRGPRVHESRWTTTRRPKTPPLADRHHPVSAVGQVNSTSSGPEAPDPRSARQRTPTGSSERATRRRDRSESGDAAVHATKEETAPSGTEADAGPINHWPARPKPEPKREPEPDDLDSGRRRPRRRSPSPASQRFRSPEDDQRGWRNTTLRGPRDTARDDRDDARSHRTGPASPTSSYEGTGARGVASPTTPGRRPIRDARNEREHDRNDARGYRHPSDRRRDREYGRFGYGEADDTRSRRSRSPAYEGRVLSRKEGSIISGADRRRNGAQDDEGGRPMQTVRGGGWKTVRAPTRSPDKAGRDEEGRAGDRRDRSGRRNDDAERRYDESSSGRHADPSSAGLRGRRRSIERSEASGRRSPRPLRGDRRREPSRGDKLDSQQHEPSPPEEAISPASLVPVQAEPDEGYVRINQVGEGTYGQVFKARSERTGVLVALKKIRMEAEKDGFPVTAMREIKLLQALRHENVVRLHEMMVARSSVYMVFEYMEHDLNGILAHPQILFSAAHLKSLSAQLFKGLAYLHHKSVLHRDLKGSNILLNNQGLLKLADFGLARFYHKRQSGDYTNRVVTLWYRPPELLFGATRYGPEVDMWGAGCIFLELFTRKPAFQGNSEVHQLQVISDVLGLYTTARWPSVQELPWYELVKPVPGAPEAVSSASAAPANGDRASAEGIPVDGAEPLQAEEPKHLAGLERSNASERSVDDIFREAFGASMPASALDVARGLLSYDPEQRLSASDALAMPYFGEAPDAEMPAGLLSALEGEWHEFESRRARRKASKRAHDQAELDARAAHAAASNEAATGKSGMLPPSAAAAGGNAATTTAGSRSS